MLPKHSLFICHQEVIEIQLQRKDKLMKTRESEAQQVLGVEADLPANEESNVEEDHASSVGDIAATAEIIKQFIDNLELDTLEQELTDYWNDPAFLELVNDSTFQDKLERACRRAIRSFKPSSIYSCEDLKQDAIARFAKWLPRYRGEAQIETVLYRIAYNLLVDVSRDPNERCCSLEDLEFKGCNIATIKTAGRGIEASTPVLSEIFIRELIDKLTTHKEQMLFVAYFVEGQPAADLALELGVSRQAVAKQLVNIAKKLKPYVR